MTIKMSPFIKIQVETEEARFTKLIPDLKDNDPDDSFCSVPYEKGHTFLFYLENLLGGSGKKYFLFKCIHFLRQLHNILNMLKFQKYYLLFKMSL